MFKTFLTMLVALQVGLTPAVAEESDPYFAFYIECLEANEGCRSVPNIDGMPATVSILPDPVITPEHFKTVHVTTPDNQDPIAVFELSSAGRDRLLQWTEKYVGRRLAIVFEGRVVSRPIIRESIETGGGQLQPNLPYADFKRMVTRLRNGK